MVLMNRSVFRRACVPAITCILLIPFLLSAGEWQKRSTRYDEAIERISAEYGLKAEFIKAMIWRESRFKARATGSVGEIGLMQLRMATVRDWAKAHARRVPAKAAVYGHELNLRIGIWRIDKALRNWEGYPEQVELALCEYNAGRTAVLRALAHNDGDADAMLRTFRSGAYAFEVTAIFESISRNEEPREYAFNLQN